MRSVTRRVFAASRRAERGCSVRASAQRINPGARPADGIWNSATATPLERPVQLKDKAVFTPEEAAEWERQFAERNQEPSPEAAAKSTGTGTYNTFYREFGTRTVKTFRTSIITDPPDGRIPALTPAAAEVKRRRVEGLRNPAGAEETGLQDRCLAFLTAGPPMLLFLQRRYQIMQTGMPSWYAEMIHDTKSFTWTAVRIFPGSGCGWAIRSAAGKATRWSSTTNFNDSGGFYRDAGGNFGWDRNLHMSGSSACSTPIRFALPVRIDSPAFTQPWKGGLTMARSPGPIYEYACHEGNYSLTNCSRIPRRQHNPTRPC